MNTYQVAPFYLRCSTHIVYIHLLLHMLSYSFNLDSLKKNIISCMNMSQPVSIPWNKQSQGPEVIKNESQYHKISFQIILIPFTETFGNYFGMIISLSMQFQVTNLILIFLLTLLYLQASSFSSTFIRSFNQNILDSKITHALHPKICRFLLIPFILLIALYLVFYIIDTLNKLELLRPKELPKQTIRILLMGNMFSLLVCCRKCLLICRLLMGQSKKMTAVLGLLMFLSMLLKVNRLFYFYFIILQIYLFRLADILYQTIKQVKQIYQKSQESVCWGVLIEIFKAIFFSLGKYFLFLLLGFFIAYGFFHFSPKLVLGVICRIYLKQLILFLQFLLLLGVQKSICFTEQLIHLQIFTLVQIFSIKVQSCRTFLVNLLLLLFFQKLVVISRLNKQKGPFLLIIFLFRFAFSQDLAITVAENEGNLLLVSFFIQVLLLFSAIQIVPGCLDLIYLFKFQILCFFKFQRRYLGAFQVH